MTSKPCNVYDERYGVLADPDLPDLTRFLCD